MMLLIICLSLITVCLWKDMMLSCANYLLGQPMEWMKCQRKAVQARRTQNSAWDKVGFRMVQFAMGTVCKVKVILSLLESLINVEKFYFLQSTIAVLQILIICVMTPSILAMVDQLIPETGYHFLKSFSWWNRVDFSFSRVEEWRINLHIIIFSNQKAFEGPKASHLGGVIRRSSLLKKNAQKWSCSEFLQNRSTRKCSSIRS